MSLTFPNNRLQREIMDNVDNAHRDKIKAPLITSKSHKNSNVIHLFTVYGKSFSNITYENFYKNKNLREKITWSIEYSEGSLLLL